jgi:hypothetical protein
VGGGRTVDLVTTISAVHGVLGQPCGVVILSPVRGTDRLAR